MATSRFDLNHEIKMWDATKGAACANLRNFCSNHFGSMLSKNDFEG
jgi:hypothetical protein